MGGYSSTTMRQYWDNHLILLSSTLTTLLTCPNNNTVLCYSNELFLTVEEKRITYVKPTYVRASAIQGQGRTLHMRKPLDHYCALGVSVWIFLSLP